MGWWRGKDISGTAIDSRVKLHDNRVMKPLFILFLFSLTTSFAHAEEITDLEIDCWHKAVDQGSFYCQYVMVMGTKKSSQEFLIPVLAAPDEGGEKTQAQAHLACRVMGFSSAVRFTLENTKEETWQVTLRDKINTGYLAPVGKKFIQHISCD